MEELYKLKYIVTELAKEPFNYEFNVSSFADLPAKQLINVLNRVMGEIDSKQKVDFDKETNEERVERTLEILRIWQYKPKNEQDPAYLERGLEIGSTEIIWNILAWLFSRLEDLKIRSYLAQFLCKVQIPFEFMDDEMEQLYQKYEQCINEFKKSHKTLQELKKSEGIAVLKDDSKNIDRDIECLSRKLDHMKAKAATIEDKDELLYLIAETRTLKDTQETLTTQMKKDTFTVTNLEQTLDIFKSRAHELRTMNNVTTPEGLLQRLDQDCEILKFITMDKLPAEIERQSKEVFAMQLVADNPPECVTDLGSIEEKINEVKGETRDYEHTLEEREMDPTLNYARHQISLSKERKHELYDILQDLHSELSSLLEQKGERKRQLSLAISKLNEGRNETQEADLLVSENDYGRYITAFKEKAGVYKPKKGELQFLQSEIGRMATTKFLLEGEYQESCRSLQTMERQMGIVGFSRMQEKLETLSSEQNYLDEDKLESVGKMSALAKELTDKIAAKKLHIEPLLTTLQSSRQTLNKLKTELELQQAKLDVELRPVLDAIAEENKKKTELFEKFETAAKESAKKSEKIAHLRSCLERAKEEMEFYTMMENGIDAPEGCQSLKDKLLCEIKKEEEAESNFHQEMNSLTANEEHFKKQKTMWTDLARLLEAKIRVRKQQDVLESGLPFLPRSGNTESNNNSNSCKTNMGPPGVSLLLPIDEDTTC